ncbi:MAG TPA: four helix bundle protein [Chitinophagales bacterium]|nr:four helix bundle protein [Chitinophagales bacterium]
MQFLSIATGAAYELETQLMLAKRIGLLTESELQVLIVTSCEIQKMISGLQKSLREKH